MSDLTIILIALVGFGAGFIGGYAFGHASALMNYHKRRDPRNAAPDPRIMVDIVHGTVIKDMQNNGPISRAMQRR